MAISEEAFRSLAHLARIQIDGSELDRIRDNLSNIIGFVEQLEAADTTGVTPMAHPLDATQRLRADEISESDRRERFQQDAPQVADGVYLVPRVIE